MYVLPSAPECFSYRFVKCTGTMGGWMVLEGHSARDLVAGSTRGGWKSDLVF